MRKSIALRKGEKWWGGASDLGAEMPFRPGAGRDLRGDNLLNQAAPLLLSNAGRSLWSPRPFAWKLTRTALRLEGRGPWLLRKDGATLAEAHRGAARRHFRPSGRIPDPFLFRAPQYSTWIELMYDQAQEPIVRYAREIVRRGYPPGLLIVDEGWFRNYGDWEFDPLRFPDPKGMVRELHRLGFKVMLWVVPFLSPDSAVFRRLRGTDVLVRDASGKIAIREWWDGHSAVVDVTGGEGRKWFRDRLDDLRRRYGVDGFKFDGGDATAYRDDDRVAVPGAANDHTEAFGTLGLDYPLNEYRAAWKCGGLPLAQRQKDKAHAWGRDGLASLVPNAIAQGLLGHSFVCPDMIGGGEYINFMANSDRLDPELFVRYAQAAALMPMMQFSAAPWRVLDARHDALCREAARLHARFGRKITAMARECARTGEPMLRSLEYAFPGKGHDGIDDQFLLGPDLLVCPVVKKGATSRVVRFPEGTWADPDGGTIRGPASARVDAPLEKLPYFVRKQARVPRTPSP